MEIPAEFRRNTPPTASGRELPPPQIPCTGEKMCGGRKNLRKNPQKLNRVGSFINWKKPDGPKTNGPELFGNKFQKVQITAKKYQLNLDKFQSQQQLLQPKYY